MWRIINSHVRAGDTTIEYFTTILKQSLGQETEEPVILFLLNQVADLFDKGLIFAD